MTGISQGGAHERQIPQGSIPGQGIPGDIDTNIQAKGTGGGERAHSKDTVSTAADTDKEGVKVTGYGWGTMSQTELDRAAPGDPRIGAQSGRLAKPGNDPGSSGTINQAPPSGSEGTGNPFFKPNPMTAFFNVGLTLVQLEKWNTLTSTKLSILDNKTALESNKASAEAIVKAGDAQAKSLIKQAIVSGVMAGVSAATLAVGVKASFAAKSEVKAAEKAVAERNVQAKSALEEAKSKLPVDDLPAQQIGSIRGKNQLLSELKQMRAQALEEGGPDFIENYKKTQGKGQKFVQTEGFDLAPKIQKSKLSEFDELDMPPTGTPLNQEQALQKAAYTEAKSKLLKPDTMEDLDNQIKDVSKDIKDEKINYRKAQDELRITKDEIRQAEHEVKHAEKEALDFAAKKPMALSQARQGQTSYVLAEGVQSTVGKLGEVTSKIFEAQGAREAAYWNAESKLLDANVQILQKGADMMLEGKRNADANVDAMCQLLQKLSDTEQSGMRWSA